MANMNLIINGQRRNSMATTVAQLLAQLHIRSDIAIVELNRKIIPHERYGTTSLTHEDVLEIITLVGGG